MRANINVKIGTVEVSRFSIMPHAPLAFTGSTSPPVEAVVLAYGSDFVDGALVDDEERHLVGCYSRFFWRLLGDYLRKLPTVTSSDPELARSVATDSKGGRHHWRFSFSAQRSSLLGPNVLANRSLVSAHSRRSILGPGSAAPRSCGVAPRGSSLWIALFPLM